MAQLLLRCSLVFYFFLKLPGPHISEKLEIFHPRSRMPLRRSKRHRISEFPDVRRFSYDFAPRGEAIR
jgi:hypothetical protein